MLIRSTAAGGRLGGLAAPTREAAQALAPAFDVVVVETVGVGQSETDVEEVCDTVAVVVQPGSGDTLQFLKAGIMEVPDVLVVTKADLGDVATRARRDLAGRCASLGVARGAGGGGVVGPAADGHRRAGRARWTSTARRSTCPPARLRARGAWPRWRSSWPSTARRRCARWAAGAAAERLLAEQDPALDVAALVAALRERR